MEHLLQDPDIDEAAGLLEEFLGRPYTVQVNGQCAVNYQGRAKSALDRGERIVLVKQDSAVLVHGPENYQPKNWQPVVDAWDVSVADGELVIEADRHDPRETLEIRFADIDLLLVDKLVDTADMQVRGHEVDIHEAIEEDPALVEDGLRVVARERKCPAGYIDVFGRDTDDNYVVIEVKRNPDYNTVLQLQRYVDEIRDEFAGTVRGILVAPKMTENVLDYLEERGLEFVEVEMADVISSYEDWSTSQKGLSDFAADYTAD